MAKKSDSEAGSAKTYLGRRSVSPGAEVPFKGDVGDLTNFPALVEFISAVKWPDGAARRTGSLTLFVDQGRLKLALNDREQGFVAFVTGDDFEGLLRAANDAVMTDDADWRAVAVPNRRSK